MSVLGRRESRGVLGVSLQLLGALLRERLSDFGKLRLRVRQGRPLLRELCLERGDGVRGPQVSELRFETLGAPALLEELFAQRLGSCDLALGAGLGALLTFGAMGKLPFELGDSGGLRRCARLELVPPGSPICDVRCQRRELFAQRREIRALVARRRAR